MNRVRVRIKKGGEFKGFLGVIERSMCDGTFEVHTRKGVTFKPTILYLFPKDVEPC